MPATPPGGDAEWLREGLKEVKDAITALSRDMNAQMARLVSQREFDRTRDDIVIDIGELRARIDTGIARHEEDIKHVREALDAETGARRESVELERQARLDSTAAAERQRRADRWRALAGVVAVLALAVSALGLTLAQLR